MNERTVNTDMTCYYHHGVSHSTDSCVYNAAQKNAMTSCAIVAEVGMKWSPGCKMHRTGTVVHVRLRRPDADIHRPKLRFLSAFGVSKWTSSPRKQSVPFLSPDDHARSLCSLYVVKMMLGICCGVCSSMTLCSNCWPTAGSQLQIWWCCEYTVIGAVTLMWWCLLCLCPHREDALSDAFVWRLSVCLTSVAYIGPNSRTERPKKTKIDTEVAHVTGDSDTTFKVKG